MDYICLDPGREHHSDIRVFELDILSGTVEVSKGPRTSVPGAVSGSFGVNY